MDQEYPGYEERQGEVTEDLDDLLSDEEAVDQDTPELEDSEESEELDELADEDTEVEPQEAASEPTPAPKKKSHKATGARPRALSSTEPSLSWADVNRIFTYLTKLNDEGDAATFIMGLFQASSPLELVVLAQGERRADVVEGIRAYEDLAKGTVRGTLTFADGMKFQAQLIDTDGSDSIRNLTLVHNELFSGAPASQVRYRKNASVFDLVGGVQQALASAVAQGQGEALLERLESMVSLVNAVPRV